MALTVNAIRDVYNGADVNMPVLQLSGVRKVNVQPGQADRYRLSLSDGVSAMQAILGTQLNPMVVNNELPNFCIVCVRKYICNTVPQNRKILIILDLHVVDTTQNQKIGNPQNIEAMMQPGQQLGGPVTPQPAAAPPSSAPPPPSAPLQPAQQQHQQQYQQHQQQQQQQQQHQHQQTNGHVSGAYAPRSIQTAPSPQPPVPQANGGYHPPSAAGPAMRATNVLPRSFGGAGNGNGHDDFINVFPISTLNPYQNKWTIKARVTSRSDLKPFHNQRGDGKLFSFDLIDETGEIRVTAFNEIATRYFDMIQQGKVFYISRGSLKAARRPFNLLKHEYEIQLDSNSIVKPCEDDTGSIPKMRFNFVPIDQLEHVEKDAAVDVLAVVKSVEELGSITAKATQKSVPKRNIVLADNTGRQVQLTLWNQHAETFQPDGNPIVAIKSVRVSDFNGRSLSTINTSMIQLDPDVPGAAELQSWFAAHGGTTTFKPISDGGMRSGSGAGGGDAYKTFAQVRSENLGGNGKPDFFSNRCHILKFRTENTISYQACPKDGCSKKVVEDGDGFVCERCQWRGPQCDYRYVLSGNVADFTGQAYASFFNDQGEQVLGLKAERVEELKREDFAQFNKIFADAAFRQYNMKIRAKMETYNGEDRVKLQAFRVEPVDFVRDAREIVKSIRQQFNL